MVGDNAQTPLTSAIAVLRLATPAVAALPHVIDNVSACLDYSVQRSLLCAVEANDVRLLQRLVAASKQHPTASLQQRQSLSRQPIRCYPRFLTFHVRDAALAAASHGSIAMLELLSQMNPRSVVHERVFADAAESGHVHVLEWMREQFVDDCDADTVAVAADLSRWLQRLHVAEIVRSGHTSVALWLAQQYRRTEQTDALRNLLERAVACGDWAIVDELRDCVTAELSSDALTEVAARGDLQMIEWLDARASAQFSDNAIVAAAGSGHVAVLEWLYRNRELPWTRWACTAAAVRGHLDVLQWLYAHAPPLPFARDMNAAARHGHLAIVQYIAQSDSASITAETLTDAARSGNLDVVKWLHSHFRANLVQCSAAAMDAAAGAGHIDVVKWLHAHRNEGCTSAAMEKAAVNGHLDVVKWLHENRREGCTRHTIDFVAHAGHLDVIKWLDANRRGGCTAQAIRNAIMADNVDVVQWLYEHRSEREFTPVMTAAADLGHFDKLKFLMSVALTHASLVQPTATAANFHWLYETLPQFCDFERIRAMARASRRVDVFEWLADIGEQSE